MSNYKTKAVGEVFRYGRVILQVVENETCKGCYFEVNRMCFCKKRYTGFCGCFRRNDNKNVIFKRIDE